MPAIKSTITVDEGVSVFNYQSGKEGWYVRKWNKHERRYRIKRIAGATTQEQALANFYKALVSFEQTEQRTNQKVQEPDVTIKQLVDEFLKWEERRVEAGLKDDVAAVRRSQSLKRMLTYLEAKGIHHPKQIDALTWDDYPVFRKHVRKGTRRSELKDIGMFCRHYLVPRGHLSNEVALSQSFIPKIVIKDDELDANPAITPDDYKVINNFLRVEFQQAAGNYKGIYTRRMFYTLVHLLKNSGCRPDEMLHVRRQDITLTNPKRWSESKQEWEDDYKLKIHIRKSKTGNKRDVICRSNSGSHLLEFLKFQRKYMNEYFPNVPLKDSGLLFGKPEDFFEKTFAYRYFDNLWEMVREGCELQGNRFSERPYTLYSLRSTFIEDSITAGLDVYLVARLCGNSVAVIQKHYDRHDVVKRAEEIQALPIGKAKPPAIETINLSEL